jgi:transketolase
MLAIDAVQKANSGHPGLPLGAADIAYVVWTRFLKHNPDDPTWPNRDRFVLSAGHGSMLLYAILHMFGYPVPLEEIKNFRQWGSHTPGHPEYEPKIGIETTTGPLGQGIGNSVGLALAERWLAARFNRPKFPIVDHHTYVLASDGDLMEGVSHEVFSFAGHLGLSKLIVYYDDNKISIDGSTDLTYSDDVAGRFESYNWFTQKVDGHDMESIDAATKKALAETDRPSIIICRTHIGYGSPREGTAKVHGEPLGEDNVALTKEFYDWPQEPPFFIPENVQNYIAEFKERGNLFQSEWEKLLDLYRDTYPELASEWDTLMKDKLLLDWESLLPDFSEEDVLATRAASGRVLESLSSHIPSLLGGSADLTGSNKTKPANAKRIQRDQYNGTYIHYGVREHGMGTILNGLTLHGGIRPYGGTFLVFSDYMRPVIRLAAMMKLPVIYVFTHDSIGLGEDGPTHQPVEHLTSLRTIPNLVVIRPADGNETSEAWKIALKRKNGPTALILTRQKLPQITPAKNNLRLGAYILAEAISEKPEIILIASGSEVSLVMNAYENLTKEGLGVRVVSMPSWELFDSQSNTYRSAILPSGPPRLAVETGVSLAWNRYVGENGAIIGLDHYGASAPYQTIFKNFGFTVENIIEHARALL